MLPNRPARLHPYLHHLGVLDFEGALQDIDDNGSLEERVRRLTAQQAALYERMMPAVLAGRQLNPPPAPLVERSEQRRTMLRRRLESLKDPREVIADPNALYSGAKISDNTLVPGNNAQLGGTRFETWLSQPAAQIPSGQPQPAAATKQKESHRKAS